jgi:hypothetical protein
MKRTKNSRKQKNKRETKNRRKKRKKENNSFNGPKISRWAFVAGRTVHNGLCFFLNLYKLG